MSHRIVEDLDEVHSLAERSAKLDEQRAKLTRAQTQWQAEYDQANAAYEDALMRSVEEGGPAPAKPEPPPVPDLSDKARRVMDQSMMLREQRTEVLKNRSDELLDQLAQREAEILLGLRDAVHLLERGAKELTDLHGAVLEVTTAAQPGRPRDEVPTDLLAVTRAVADGCDALPTEEPAPLHTVMRSG